MIRFQADNWQRQTHPAAGPLLLSRAVAIGLIASLGVGVAASPAFSAPRAGIQARPPVGATPPVVDRRIPRIVDVGVLSRGPGGAARAPGRLASPARVLDTYPRDGGTHISPNAILYFAFDEPTSKSGSVSVADLDSAGLPLLNLDSPTWSALGDTMFVRPSAPMTRGHQCGMKLNTIVFPDTILSDPSGVQYFRILPWPKLERVPNTGPFSSVTLVPGTTVPVSTNVRELNNSAVTFTSARIEFWDSPTATFGSGPSPSPLSSSTVPFHVTVSRSGSAQLTLPVTLPTSLARTAASGRLGLRITYTGSDELGSPITFEANSSATLSAPPDTLLSMSPALVTSAIASNLVVQSAYLETPFPGAVFAAGDTVRARGVVTGIGTGAFRAVFYLDGNAVAMEVGYMESGRPVTVEPEGPIVSRRFGEHRFQFVVETPQNVSSPPITFLCVPPANGVLMPAAEVLEGDSVAAPPPPSRLTLGGTYMVVGKSEFRDEEASGIAWSAWNAKYDVTKTGALEANVLWRLRVDDVENGSASPEQAKVRYTAPGGSVEWGDVTPSIAKDAPLFASPVPRRSAQAAWSGSAAGTLEGFVAFDSHPRSAYGPIQTVSSDLYAGRLTRKVGGDRFLASLYGGYAHDDPTPGSLDSVTTAHAVYGGMGRVAFAGDWTLLGDVATVRHKAIEGVDPGRSRTGVRGELKGEVAGFGAKAEAFRYQPDLATTLNPYAISDRRGMAAELSRDVTEWRFFANYRTEKPDQDMGVAPVIRVDRWSVGGQLKLNQVSFVIPSLIRIQHHGENTDFSMSRVAGELIIGEKYGGETRARIDLTRFDDPKGVNAKRFVGSGSLVTTRKHTETITSTLSGGLEHNEEEDLKLTDKTLQGALEMRWEAVRGKLLVIPLVTYYDRNTASINLDQERITARLQLALLRVPKLGENALSIEGRMDRYKTSGSSETESREGSVQISFGQRFGLLP